MKTATFRLYGELNDFLPANERQREVVHEFLGSPAVKDAIEALGVPHVEVDLVLVDGEPAGFAQRLNGGERVAVYPVFTRLDLAALVRVRAAPLRRVAFVVDGHLGKLARLLRLLGFDAEYAKGYRDEEIVALATRGERILLTRDRELLKRNAIAHGYWVRSTEPLEQAREVVRRFGLETLVRPFERCLACNGVLAPVTKEDVLRRIPPKVRTWRDEFFLCSACDRLYWRGTHYPRLEEWIATILRG
jgi:uncharacterized protein with PIN domain